MQLPLIFSPAHVAAIYLCLRPFPINSTSVVTIELVRAWWLPDGSHVHEYEIRVDRV